jgi:hypothetical protein
MFASTEAAPPVRSTLVDGIPITQNMDRQVSNTVPTIEDTSEFKVVTNGLGAHSMGTCQAARSTSQRRRGTKSISRIGLRIHAAGCRTQREHLGKQ